MGEFLGRFHDAFMALCGKRSILTGEAVNPFAVTIGTIDALIERATARRDMQTVGKLTATKTLINRECLRGAR